MRRSRWLGAAVAIAMVATLLAPVGASGVEEAFPIITHDGAQNQIEMGAGLVTYTDHRAPGNPAVYAVDVDTGAEFVVSNTVGTQNNSSAHGDRIVFMKKVKTWTGSGWDGIGDIQGYKISTGEHFTVSNNPAEQGNPFVWGDWCVWVDGRDCTSNIYSTGNKGIYGYNFATGMESAILTYTASVGRRFFSPALYENQMVSKGIDSSGYYEIWHTDLTSMESTVIATTSATNRYFYCSNIYANWIVWYENWHDGQSNYRVWAHDLSSDETTIVKEWSTDNGQNPSPDVWNGLVVWADTESSSDRYDVSILMADLDDLASGATTISGSLERRRGRPRISDGVVAWTQCSYDGSEQVIEDGADIWGYRLDPEYSSVMGFDRYGTACAVSELQFPAGADTVVIGRGDDWPDALAASALAGAVNGPVLLVCSDHVPDGIMDELHRLGARSAYVVGGPSAVSESVFDQIDDYLLGTVTRLGGANRFQTAALVAEEFARISGSDYDGTAFVTTGESFPDAVGAAALAAGKGWPVLLTYEDVLPAATTNALTSIGATHALVLGGTSAVSAAVKTQLEGSFVVDRLWGGDRYETALAVAQYGVDRGMTWNAVALATGEGYPDALAAGVMQGLQGSVLALTPGTDLHDSVAAKLATNADHISCIRFVGGLGAVTQPVRDEAWNLIK